ncbi:MAG TPA: DUF1549 domain-containing protein [Candidatus Acidoferrum sp.]|nr:DUF1549 domain-containing protein [Candidatus Acidoferrum sp.]
MAEPRHGVSRLSLRGLFFAAGGSRRVACVALVLCSPFCSAAQSPITPEQVKELPPPASHTVSFSKEVKPIFESSCITCHGRGRDKGGFRLDTRETMLQGGDSGAALVPGKSAESLLIALVQGVDPDNVMPRKGSRLTAEQIGLLRAWIDQGAQWDAGITFGRAQPANLLPRLPPMPAGTGAANPIDRFLDAYFAAHEIKPPVPVNDRLYARRVYLDVIGLLPPPPDLKTFVRDGHAGKRDRLVQRLLSDNQNYAVHWLSFWNDLLRNDYKGTGYIDGGRKQITHWLYSALLTNMPYNQFVAELVNPTPDSEGFSRGIVWRGVVNASQTPQMQTAQNICQVFMGVNLKCASCHDSFINDLTLADAYGLAGIYADGPLEMVRCDKPTGKQAVLKFLYSELGAIDPHADKAARLKRLAEIITQRQDARLTRTLINRLWQRFMGRGLVEPVDDMEKPAWNRDLLDWLAEDFAGHDYDVKHLVRQILTSRAYQLPAVNLDEQHQQDYVFRGPVVRRLSAEQFRDALTSLTGIGYSAAAADVPTSPSARKRFDPAVAVKWIWNDANAAEKARPGHVYFRRTIRLAKVPTDAAAVVMCDNSFTLYLNGAKVGSGASWKEAFLFDLRPFLKPGDNLFAVDAINHLPDDRVPDAGEPPADTYNPAGLLFYARLRGPNSGSQYDFVSDSAWICSGAKADWESDTFVRSNWTAAVVLGDIEMIPWRVSKTYLGDKLAAAYPGSVRAALVAADPLQASLARPNREQVVTTRSTTATTLQALELTNGETLTDVLRRGAENLLGGGSANVDLVSVLYEKALGRKPTRPESRLARDLAGHPPQPAGVEDLLWTVVMLPEFQLIY